MKKIRPIAFYLPQFFPTPENDEWWSPGFTEWTNVARAKPLFPGHYQPRIPADLSFYDLRVPSVRERQAALAREAGIEGFCYWHYWFNGRRLLDRVFAEVVESGKPDFPFCLCWANHSWSQKTWDPNLPNKLLMEQTYPGKDDYVAHFNAMLPAFRDKRYIKVDGKLLFGVFSPADIPDTDVFFDTWNALARENGLEGFYFFGLSQGGGEYARWKDLPYDAVVYDCLNDTFNHPEDDGFRQRLVKRLRRKLFGYPYTTSYVNYISRTREFLAANPGLCPCIEPDFDHSPRSGGKWIIVDGSTPERWGELCRVAADAVASRENGDGLVLIKSWNEWGEGNYLEPDMKWGHAYLDAMAEVLKR